MISRYKPKEACVRIHLPRKVGGLLDIKAASLCTALEARLVFFSSYVFELNAILPSITHCIIGRSRKDPMIDIRPYIRNVVLEISSSKEDEANFVPKEGKYEVSTEADEEVAAIAKAEFLSRIEYVKPMTVYTPPCDEFNLPINRTAQLLFRRLGKLAQYPNLTTLTITPYNQPPLLHYLKFERPEQAPSPVPYLGIYFHPIAHAILSDFAILTRPLAEKLGQNLQFKMRIGCLGSAVNKNNVKFIPGSYHKLVMEGGHKKLLAMVKFLWEGNMPYLCHLGTGDYGDQEEKWDKYMRKEMEGEETEDEDEDDEDGDGEDDEEDEEDDEEDDEKDDDTMDVNEASVFEASLVCWS
ncbi:uncharacterized protein KY384_006262 [Bacidia gigantensis]|uniref:uncharacterized protein n=1 Tax=Bacidia gigantensis TaxID=2732470 RepID=UPI001D03CA04|nr:uncharacterized protein KY384_006262 [Bacidia gigantensis]KAG8528575.1 hypothetical protein KY384_006262 [Bacidia gigantensis]